jgi:formylglycine-generating enzyme required for sulfatase activity
MLKVSVAFGSDLSDAAARDAAARDAQLILVGWSDDCFPHGGDIDGTVLRCAAIGRKRGVLLPVLLEPTALEPPWNQMPTKSLMAWSKAGGQGPEAAAEWQSLMRAIGVALGRSGLADYALAEAGGLTALDRWARNNPADPLARDIKAKVSMLLGVGGAPEAFGEPTEPALRMPQQRRLQARDAALAAAWVAVVGGLVAGGLTLAGRLSPPSFEPTSVAAAPTEGAAVGSSGGGGFSMPSVSHIWEEVSSGLGFLASGAAGGMSNGGATGGEAQSVVMHGEVARTAAPSSRTAPPPTPEELANAGPLIIVDVRTVRRQERAPVVLVPSRLPDFAVFRECEECPEMVVLPAGTFLMGSPTTEVGRGEDEDDQAGPGGRPVQVSLPRFAIARYETNWDEWRACVAAGGCDNTAINEAGGDNGWGWGRRPVIEVTATQEPVAFARWVSEATGGPYRLPTEAEWEYAARAGGTSPFPWGDTAGRTYANYGADECCAGHAEGADDWIYTAPVGSFRANPWGLFDMHGNVMEWVEDCYRGHLRNQPTDGAAFVDGACASRVLRGGSWDYMPGDIRSAYRLRLHPERRFNFIGFRLARSL